MGAGSTKVPEEDILGAASGSLLVALRAATCTKARMLRFSECKPSTCSRLAIWRSCLYACEPDSLCEYSGYDPSGRWGSFAAWRRFAAGAAEPEPTQQISCDQRQRSNLVSGTLLRLRAIHHRQTSDHLVVAQGGHCRSPRPGLRYMQLSGARRSPSGSQGAGVVSPTLPTGPVLLATSPKAPRWCPPAGLSEPALAVP